MDKERKPSATEKPQGGPGSGIGPGGDRLPNAPTPQVDESGKKGGKRIGDEPDTDDSIFTTDEELGD